MVGYLKIIRPFLFHDGFRNLKIYRWANPLLVLMIKSKWSFHTTIAQSHIMADTRNLRYSFKNRQIQLLFRQNSGQNFFIFLFLSISCDMKLRPFKFILAFWCPLCFFRFTLVLTNHKTADQLKLNYVISLVKERVKRLNRGLNICIFVLIHPCSKSFFLLHAPI